MPMFHLSQLVAYSLTLRLECLWSFFASALVVLLLAAPHETCCCDVWLEVVSRYDILSILSHESIVARTISSRSLHNRPSRFHRSTCKSSDVASKVISYPLATTDYLAVETAPLEIPSTTEYIAVDTAQLKIPSSPTGCFGTRRQIPRAATPAVNSVACPTTAPPPRALAAAGAAPYIL